VTLRQSAQRRPPRRARVGQSSWWFGAAERGRLARGSSRDRGGVPGANGGAVGRGYSARSASVGPTRAARAAGRYPATAALIASTPSAAAIDGASTVPTPNS